LAAVLNHVPACQNFYLRAHRREIVLLQNAISCISIGVFVWLLGSRYGATGAAAAYLAVTALVTVPYQTYLYQRFRAETSEA
jgi:O-antigen/teichoic acid export membrane protein